jgi:hypothetical protein
VPCGLILFNTCKVWRLLDAKSPPKPLKFFPCKGFGESVSNLLCSWNILQLYCPGVLGLSLPPALNFHMFCARVVLRVRGQSYGPLLSPQMIVAVVPWLMFNSLRSFLNQTASLVACVCPRNSASQIERATTLWRFDC